MPGAVLLGTLATLGLAMAVFSLLPLSPAQKGALVLASSFGNVTYLGLPLLQGLVPALGLQAAKLREGWGGGYGLQDHSDPV